MIDENLLSDIIRRLDDRYVKKHDCDTAMSRTDERINAVEKDLAVIKFQIKINNWLTAAIASGIIALVIKVFLGG